MKIRSLVWAFVCGLLVFAAPAKAQSLPLEYLERECSAGIAVACGYVGMFYAEGRDGIKEDVSKAAELYDKACELGGARECNGIGYYYKIGKGVRKDLIKAAEFFGKSCDGGFASGCFNLGLLYREGAGVEMDLVKAAELFGKACDLKLELGCENYARLKN